MNKRIIYVTSTVAVVILVAILVVMLKPGAKNDPSPSAQQFSGTVVCVPKKTTNPATTECLYGLHTADDKDYLIHAAKFPEGTVITNYDTGSQVVVIGTVSTSNAEQEMYDIAGVISATEVRRQ